MSPERVDFISECFVKPHSTPEASERPHHMTPWDLAMLSVHHIQKGLLYPKPNHPQFFDPCSVMMGSSPRFNKYGIEFGLGKALALRSGYANKFDGKVTSYPGYEGRGSIDLEVCLPIDSMRALESDNEFMDAATLSNQIIF